MQIPLLNVAFFTAKSHSVTFKSVSQKRERERERERKKKRKTHRLFPPAKLTRLE